MKCERDVITVEGGQRCGINRRMSEIAAWGVGRRWDITIWGVGWKKQYALSKIIIFLNHLNIFMTARIFKSEVVHQRGVYYNQQYVFILYTISIYEM